MHIESGIANTPCNQVTCRRNVDCEKAIDGEALGPRADKTGGATIRKKQKREYVFQILCLLKVERAEFEVQYENVRASLRTNDVMRQLQGIDGCITTHESDHRPFDRRVKFEMAYNQI